MVNVGLWSPVTSLLLICAKKVVRNATIYDNKESILTKRVISSSMTVGVSFLDVIWQSLQNFTKFAGLNNSG